MKRELLGIVYQLCTLILSSGISSINILKLGVHLHSIGRLFLTMDPIHGELSRAMRNRGTEIYMLPSVSLRIKSLELTNMIECAFRTVPWMSSYTKKIYFR